MLFPAVQAFVGRDEKRTPPKTPAWEARVYLAFWFFAHSIIFPSLEIRSIPRWGFPSSLEAPTAF